MGLRVRVNIWDEGTIGTFGSVQSQCCSAILPKQAYKQFNELFAHILCWCNYLDYFEYIVKLAIFVLFNMCCDSLGNELPNYCQRMMVVESGVPEGQKTLSSGICLSEITNTPQ